MSEQHGNHENQQAAIKATYFSIVGNTLLATLKWLAGYFGNSYALIADAIESTSDIFSSLMVWFGLTYASRPADENHPYGHGRAEPLVTFLVVAFLVTSATIIAIQSISNIRTPHELPEAYTLIILGAIITWKEISYRVVMRKSKQTKSTSLKADAWHHRSDAITSVAAFVGISIALIFGKGYEAADDWAALFASGFILYNAYLIFRPALGEIMDENVHQELIANIRKISLTVEGVIATEKCFIRKTGLMYQVDLHITVDANLTVKEGHAIAHQLKDVLMHEIPEVSYVLIHVEPNN
jgi:cation diffusion facilitator family transporter